MIPLPQRQNSRLIESRCTDYSSTVQSLGTAIETGLVLSVLTQHLHDALESEPAAVQTKSTKVGTKIARAWRLASTRRYMKQHERTHYPSIGGRCHSCGTASGADHAIA